MTDTETLTKLLSRITSQEFDASTPVKLSSVQTAAFSSMCNKAGVAFDRSRLRGTFTITQLVSGDVAQVPDKSTERNASESEFTHAPLSGQRVGCDIQSISEFSALIDHTDFKRCPFLVDNYSYEEISYCENQKEPVTSLCGLHAAKEAIFKAGKAVPFRQITIEHHDGIPLCEGYSISISHSGAYCMAVAATGAFLSGEAPEDEVSPEAEGGVEGGDTPLKATNYAAPSRGSTFGRIFMLVYHLFLAAIVLWLLSAHLGAFT